MTLQKKSIEAEAEAESIESYYDSFTECQKLIQAELDRFERETNHLRNGSKLNWTKELMANIIAKWMVRHGINSAIN